MFKYESESGNYCPISTHKCIHVVVVAVWLGMRGYNLLSAHMINLAMRFSRVYTCNPCIIYALLSCTLKMFWSTICSYIHEKVGQFSMTIYYKV